MKNRVLVVALLIVSSAALVWHSLLWNFVTDDAYITFVYSRNLVEAGQLVFNLGERVEGYTNFLWTVLLAGLLRVGLQPELMSRVLGTAFAVGTLWVCGAFVRRVRRDASLAIAVPALFLCTSPGYACWSSGGLETQMFAFFVTAAFARYLGRMLEARDPDAWLGALMALAALTRPEGILFFGLLGLHRAAMLVRQRRFLPTAGDWMAAAAFCAPVAVHLVWRHGYYGWWLPNTFYIKASGGAGTWGQGAYYLGRMAVALEVWMVVPVAVIALVVVSSDVALRRVALFTALVVGVFYAYVASVGGDFMGLFRFALPVLPLLTILLALALGVLMDRAPAAAAGALVALLAAHALHAVPVTEKAQELGADRGIDTPGFLRWYTADRAAIGKWFGAHRLPDDFAAVGGAGAQVYYSRMPSLDCYGLSDAHIAHEVKAQSNRPGHQKYAPLEYQLAKKPTIITSNYYRCCSPAFGNAPFRPSPYEANDWRTRGYRYVTAKIDGLSYPYYSFLLRNDRNMTDLVLDPERSP